jgi:PAS domain S-box-containing protein
VNTARDQVLHAGYYLGNVLDNIHDMIFIFTPSTLRFVYVNNGVVGTTGFDREDLLQMTPMDVLPIPEPECRAFLSPLISGKKRIRRFEAMARRNSGRDFPVEVQLQLVPEDGTGLFVAIVRDITKRKFAEHELRQQKKLLRQVIDMDPNMIFVKDANGRFLLANQAIADYYGVAIRDMIGKNNSEFDLDPQDVKWFLASDQEVIEHRREVVLRNL